MSEKPRRRGVYQQTLGSAIAAGLSTALIEVALTLQRTQQAWNADARHFALALASLYVLLALAVGVVEALIVSALVATGAVDLARSLIKKIVADAQFDRAVAGSLMATLLSAAAYAGWIGFLAFKLVANSHRHLVASVVCGVLSMISLPAFVLLAFPVERVTVVLARAIPRLGRLPATVLLILFTLAASAIGGTLFVESRIDWHALRLGAPLAISLLLLLQGIWAWLMAGPLARVGVLRRSSRPLLAVGLSLALLAPFVALRGLSGRALVLVFEESSGGHIMVQVVQALFDRDHDGYSTILGGGDCDDHDARVHPGAHDWPDDGIDQNCLGGDAHRQPPPPPPRHAEGGFNFRGNVIFIFVDTLRGDKITPELMPNLDALSRGGVRFSRSYAQAPGTARSVPSLLTSRLPSRIKWDEPNQDYPSLLLENRTVFEALQDAGYYTVGVASHYYFNTSGLTQGFDEFDNGAAPPLEEATEDVSSPRIVARVERLLPRLIADGRRFALLVHLPDPHASYLPHPEIRHGAPAPTTIEGRYDEEVKYTDGYLGRLFRLLGEQHLSENTMVVVFADHGEAFGAHRDGGQAIFTHRHTLNEEVLHVPLIKAAPGLTPRIVAQPVALMDVAPTVLDVLGLPLPHSFQGRSLAGALAGLPLDPAPVFAEILPSPAWPAAARALVDADGRTKVIYRITHPRFEVYDLVSDPGEQHDLSDLQPELTARMRDQMAAWLDASP